MNVPDNNTLKDLQILVEKLNTTNSTNEKVSILKKVLNPDIKKLLNWIYNPMKNFYVTSKNVEKFVNQYKEEWKFENVEDIFILLEDLSERRVTGYNALIKIKNYIDKRQDYKELIYNIIDKNLKCRIDVKLINKAFPDYKIPEFNVALAKKYDDYKDKINFVNQEWYASRKLDGCRCLAFITKNGVKFFSRQGKEFFTLNNLIPWIEGLCFQEEMVLDGEICMLDENGNENFSDIMKEIRRKNHTIEKPFYYIFDCLTLNEFQNCKSETNLKERIGRIENLNLGDGSLRILSQWYVATEYSLEDYIGMAESKGWEGLILRRNTKYEGKRSNDLLKVKSFKDDEYKVKDVEFGNIRYIEEGKEIEEEMLSAVHIKHKGYDVKVGSGFTIEQRRKFYKNPKDILNKIITVKYFEESHDQNGNLSLRFPTLKCIHEKERNT